ncbi:MAG: SpoIID/LytB domain-containing protein [Oscillospiraceae bacterium]|nr:SpoIID/LytB domain-containing protein [Oscillospiraceae bacterium]
MKRKFVQIAALGLVTALLLTVCGGTASAAPAGSDKEIIRVGLHYGTGAIEGLNLLNEVGSGYRFGYYDGSNRFVELGSTGKTAISVVETMNVYYGTYDNYQSYHTTITSGVAVGEYHLQLPGSYASFAQAQAAASQYPGGFAAYIGGTYYARVGNYTTRDGAVAAQAALGAGAQLCGTSGYGVSVVETGTSTILFQYDDLGQGTGLGVEPIQTGGEKCTTWSKGFLYNGGFRFERIGGGKLTVVNIVGFEDYVKGVVSAEMSTSWSIEALKAQAVAARSYALTLGTKHGTHHFDICDDIHCQRYTGQTSAGANSNAAVDQTVGQVALYNGKVAETYYYSSNGGASQSVSVVWGTNQSLYPYLTEVVDPYEPTLNLKNTWERTFTSAQLISKLLAGNNVTAPIVSAEITSYTSAGNPWMITFTDSAGKSFPVRSGRVYSNLGLPSCRFGFAGSGSGQPAPTPPSGSISINGTTQVSGVSGLYAIDGNGGLTALGGDVYVVTDSGTAQLGQGGGQSQGQGSGSWAGSASAANGSITFAGRGWGHNIGMSQFGAKAMAEQGHTYQQILQFYYTGITVGYT